jgi:hypothetical protein|tara:strand:- start:807 stop:1109 length:303 start_codon:yes stop_codon:yes gene_type:complete
MQIPSLVYISIGVIVVGYSWILDKSSGTEKMVVFFYLGLIFLVFGLVKQFILRKSPEDKMKGTLKPVQTQFHNYCRRCKQQVNMFDNFCSRCGEYLKGRG